jgi:hypothetical protein
MILVAGYILLTMSIQEGMIEETNIKIALLRSTEDWDSVQSEIQTFLEDTSSDRYILMYPSGGNINDSIEYLEGIGEEEETDTKMLLYVWTPLDEDVSAALVEMLGIDSVPTPFTKGLFTFEADSEAVTETDYNVSIATGSNSGKKNKKDKKGVVNKAKNIGSKAKDIGSKAKDGAKKFFGGKKKKK